MAIHLVHMLPYAFSNLPGYLMRKTSAKIARYPYLVLLPVGFAYAA